MSKPAFADRRLSDAALFRAARLPWRDTLHQLRPTLIFLVPSPPAREARAGAGYRYRLTPNPVGLHCAPGRFGSGPQIAW